ncbi:MAG: hypothetical protein Q8R78_01095, partial [Candidatus Omnitrophota bacterium]|nr:hypothetical protein [Candidatus Omnitrophota bacterium]
PRSDSFSYFDFDTGHEVTVIPQASPQTIQENRVKEEQATTRAQANSRLAREGGVQWREQDGPPTIEPGLEKALTRIHALREAVIRGELSYTTLAEIEGRFWQYDTWVEPNAAPAETAGAPSAPNAAPPAPAASGPSFVLHVRQQFQNLTPAFAERLAADETMQQVVANTLAKLQRDVRQRDLRPDEVAALRELVEQVEPMASRIPESLPVRAQIRHTLARLRQIAELLGLGAGSVSAPADPDLLALLALLEPERGTAEPGRKRALAILRFPLNQRITDTFIDPVTLQPQRRLSFNGRTLEIETPTKLTRVFYDASGTEQGSQTVAIDRATGTPTDIALNGATVTRIIGSDEPPNMWQYWKRETDINSVDGATRLCLHHIFQDAREIIAGDRHTYVTHDERTGRRRLAFTLDHRTGRTLDETAYAFDEATKLTTTQMTLWSGEEKNRVIGKLSQVWDGGTLLETWTGEGQDRSVARPVYDERTGQIVVGSRTYVWNPDTKQVNRLVEEATVTRRDATWNGTPAIEEQVTETDPRTGHTQSLTRYTDALGRPLGEKKFNGLLETTHAYVGGEPVSTRGKAELVLGDRRVLIGESTPEPRSLTELAADPKQQARLADTVWSKRIEYGYDDQQHRYVTHEWVEFYRGKRLVAKLDEAKGLFSVRRAEGETTTGKGLLSFSGVFSPPSQQPGRDKSGWDDYAWANGQVGALEQYSVDTEVADVLAVMPQPLSGVTHAAQVYTRNRQTRAFAWDRTMLLDQAGHEHADITRHPLYFTPERQVMNIARYANDADAWFARPQERHTYAYDPQTRTIEPNVIGTAVRRDAADVVDSTSRAEVERALGKKGISLFEITDYERGKTWWAFFDIQHEHQPLARIEGGKLYLTTYFGDLPEGEKRAEIEQWLQALGVPDKRLIVVGEDTFELRGTTVGNKIYRSLINTTLDLAALARAVGEKKHTAIEQALLTEALGYTIEALYPERPSDRAGETIQPAVNAFTGIFHKHQELVKIDHELNRLSIKLYDEAKPWQDMAGIDYHYTDGRIGELLALAVTLPNERRNGEEYKPVFVIDAGQNMAFIEYRDIVDGIAEIREEGDYPDRLPVKRLATLLPFVQRSAWPQARAAALNGFEPFVRMAFAFDSFDADQDGTPEYSAAYLRALGMPVQAASFLYDTKAGAFKALANSTSTLVDLVMRYGEGEAHPGVRIVALRSGKGDVEVNGTTQTLQTHRIQVRNEHGRK